MITCPKCGAEVEVEVIWGRRRDVTCTKVHMKPGTATVCHVILKTKENR